MANARLIEELARSRGGDRAPAPTIERSLRELGHPDLRRARPRRGRPAHDRRGAPAARRRRAPGSTSSTRRSACSRPVLGGRGADPRDGLAARPRRQARGRRVGPRRPDRRDVISRRLPDRRDASSTATGPTRTRAARASRRHRHAAVRRPGPVRRDHRVVDARRTRSARSDASLLETIAGQSAVALGRARLIEELGRSRETLARRAEEERALREIARRLGTMGDDPGRHPLRIVHESARLLGGERARLDLLEPLVGLDAVGLPAETSRSRTGSSRWSSSATARTGRPTGSPASRSARGGRSLGRLHARHAVRALRRGRRGASAVGLALGDRRARSIGEEGLLGVLQAGHRDVDAFGEDATRLIAALAASPRSRSPTPASSTGSRSSQAALGRTADAERALREIARRMMTHPGPGGAAPGRRRRGGPPARVERRGHRPPRPGDRRDPLGVRRRHRRRGQRRAARRARRRTTACSSRSASGA